jgi:hypothetical protein
MGRRLIHLVCIAVVLGTCSSSWGQKKASGPFPAEGKGDVAMPLLQWTPGSTAVFHDVYLSKSPQLGPKDLIQPHQTQLFVYYMAGFEAGVTYYWRVDEIEADGTTIYTGDVWTFTTQAPTAYNPNPADGAATVSPTVTLKWWPGQSATQHHLYFSTDRNAVSQAAASANKGLLDLTQTTFAPGTLEGATTYYWRVDEVVAGAVRAGPVWSFTTVVLIDDFERYTDVEGSTIYQTWLGYDGVTNKTGAYVGYPNPPFAEPKITHDGSLQSMPLDFNNMVAPFYSEAERPFGSLQDWTAGGVDRLLLYVRGRPVDFEIPFVSTPPVIDGKVDDIWSKASIQSMKTTITGNPPTGPADCSGQFRELYDADNLYVLADVNDDKLFKASASWYLGDSVEVYVDGDNTKAGPGLIGHARQYTFGWSQTVIQGTNTDLTGVQFTQVNTPTGYRMEIKLPWQALIGSRAPVGKLIGVDCFINETDQGNDIRDRQLAWHSTMANDWQTAASWGTAKVAPPAGAGKPDVVYVALQDSANHTAVVTHPDPQITKAANWVQWTIPLRDFTGVNLAKIKKMMIGVGDKTNQTAGGLGLIYIDDISLAVPEPAK